LCPSNGSICLPTGVSRQRRSSKIPLCRTRCLCRRDAPGGPRKPPGTVRPGLTPWQLRRQRRSWGRTRRVLRELPQLTDIDLHELRQTGVIA
jgi:uncharacterized protein YjiS (DUF1127 family)